MRCSPLSSDGSAPVPDPWHRKIQGSRFAIHWESRHTQAGALLRAMEPNTEAEKSQAPVIMYESIILGDSRFKLGEGKG